MDNKEFVPKSKQFRVTKAEYATSLDPRGYIPVYEYSVNGDSFMWDRQTGDVYMTGIFKALGFGKHDITNTLQQWPKLSVKKIRGGFLKIQGTWIPYNTAKDMCKKIAKGINEHLTPIFGSDFSKQPSKSHHPQNKHIKHDTAGLCNKDMNIQSDKSSFSDDFDLGKRKRVDSHETVYVNSKKHTSNTESLNITTTSVFHLMNPSFETYDDDNDDNDLYEEYVDKNISRNGKKMASVSKNQNSDTITSNQLVPNFRVVPATYQRDADATVPDCFNQFLEHSTKNDDDDYLKKKRGGENKKESPNTWQNMADAIEATVILHGLANNFQDMQQTVPDTFVVDDMAFNILWE